ncbi:clavesin-1 [Tribolium castaneum]|uniref:Alpha-tocopherol transfer protein-like n=1 Tax=Tribolium castaneum TaxID=7070 RepID=D2A331_TRICA|nr:PREDICTED: clavesin-1 [Tribolium castaneum]EFA02785.1 Alpha-tocopherol transfer protein-like [Tribolium castaneum]|eukprot:XP_008192445.1 PREDICTED: clavesin-1 [Tribolium castaneum]
MNPNIFHIDENVRKNALEEHNKTEETAREDAKTIQIWMKTQHHLPEVMDEAKIINFLFMNKFNVEKTKRKIDTYYTVRSLIPDFFEQTNPKSPLMREVVDALYFGVCPKALNDKHRVFIIKVRESNKFGPRELVMHSANVTEMRLYEDCFGSGEILIFDMINVSLSDLKKLTPTVVAKILAIFQKVYSIRSEGIYILNSPSYVSVVISILKSVLKPKIFERVQVCENTDILKTIISSEDIPKDYGGEGPTLEELHEMVNLKLAFYQDRFDELDHLRVDESLRAEKLNTEEILGIYGKFKKFHFD